MTQSNKIKTIFKKIVIVLYVPLENFINMEDFTKSRGNEGFELVLWSVLLSLKQ